MKRWNANGRPIVAFAVCWINGYALAAAFSPSWLTWKIGLGALAALFLAEGVSPAGRLWIRFALVALLAASYYDWFDERNVSHLVPRTEESTGVGNAAANAAQLNETEITVSGRIASAVEIDGDRVAFVLEAQRIESGPAELLAKEKWQVSIRLLEKEERDRASVWARGDRIRLTGTIRVPEAARNFGGFDYRLYLYRQRIHWQLSVKGLSAVETPAAESEGGERGKPAFARFPDRMREAVYALLRANDKTRAFLGSRLDDMFPGTQTGYMKSLLIGLREEMDPEQFRHFSQLGLTHVLAISGLHVAVFVAGCVGIMRLAGLTRETYLTAAFCLVPLYVLLTGASPSAVRAGLMAMIGLYATRRHLWKDALHLLAAAAVLMLIWNPYYLFDVSFQLSFLVTAGLILGVPRFNRLLPVRSPFIRSAISVTTVAQLVSFPITIYYFNQFSLLSWTANLLLVPLISFIVLPLGTAALLIGLVWPQAGVWAAKPVSLLNDWTYRVIRLGADHDPFQTVWPSPALFWIGLYFAALAAIYRAMLDWSKFRRAVPLTAALAGMTVLVWYAYDPHAWTFKGNVHFIDVGQGDAILIRTPYDRVVLIDGGGTPTFRGPDEAWKERRDPYEVGNKLLVPLLKKRGVHRIDVLVASHQDTDHIGGLQAVLEQIPVRSLWFNGTWKGNETSEKLFRTAIEKGVKLLAADAGQTVTLDKHTEMIVLAPQTGGRPIETEEEQNGRSVVLLMRMYGTRFLFTGDMTTEEERAILKHWQLAEGKFRPGDGTESASTAPYPIDVLKVAHHGSKSSTSAEWIAFWRPKQAVISVGSRNVYGHPHEQVTGRLSDAGVTVYRTDLHGEVQVTVTEAGMMTRTKRNGE